MAVVNIKTKKALFTDSIFPKVLPWPTKWIVRSLRRASRSKKSINFKRNAELFFNRLLGVQWLVDLTLHFAVGPNNEQVIPNLLTELNIFSDPDSRSFVEQKSPQFSFQWEKWYFVPKIVLTVCEKKNVLVIKKNTFEIRGWRPRISKMFEITGTVEQFTYWNSERSEQFL